MSDSNPMAAFGDFGKWVPGFEFLKGLSQGGGSQALPQVPGLGQWVAPTVNVQELDKRIQELKTVLFWLEQNATALKATIQAMEVQKMTLSALQGMNMSMQDMAKAFSIPQAPQAPQAPQPAAKGFAGLEVPPLQRGAAAAPSSSAARARKKPAPAPADAPAAAAQAAAAGMVDPAQWWGALTQQFQTIADAALRDAKARSADLPAGMKAAAEQALKGGQAWSGAAQTLAKAAAKSTGRKPAAKSNAKPARKKAAAQRSR